MRARADGRTGADDTVGRMSGRGRRGRKAADGRADGGGKDADSGAEGRTGPTRRGHVDGRKRRGQGLGGVDGRTSGRANKRSGGRADWAVRACIARTAGWADGRTSRRADKRVGLGLKGHIPRGPLHSWVPSPLASSEHEHVGCLGVQWDPPLFHIKHPYLAPRLTCLV